MASQPQIFIVLLLLCVVGFMFGWTARDMKNNKIRRFKVKRRKKRGYFNVNNRLILYNRKSKIYEGR